jgi:hypothetical protein
MERPTPRPEAFRAYWHFAAERQRVFEARLAGLPTPWTEDAIIGEYKFCNVFRASDRISQYLIRDVIYAHDLPDEDVLLRTILFRLFSKSETWEALEADGPLTLRTFDPERLHRILAARRAAGQAIYTNAFILCANDAYGYREKHRNHLALVADMFKGGALPRRVAGASSLEDLYLILRSYPLLGEFMAYQLAVDICYSEVVGFDEDDFVVAGPGAQRGIRKCFTDTCGWDDTRVIEWMRAGQKELAASVGVQAPTLWGRRLHSIDCQGLFCETDKYCRVALPHLASNRVRIKARFSPDPAPIEHFYPPKWGLNDRVAVSRLSSPAP